jgi:YD repeat-containing protein
MAKRLQVLVCVASTLALLRPTVSGAEAMKDASRQVVHLARDTSGCEPIHAVVNADGSRHVMSTECWPQSRLPRRTVDEELDRAGRATRRVVQEFDARGRPILRRAFSIDAAGEEHGSLTRYTYDAGGRASETTSPIER